MDHQDDKPPGSGDAASPPREGRTFRIVQGSEPPPGAIRPQNPKHKGELRMLWWLPERTAEEAPSKKREPRTRFTCLLPLPDADTVFPVLGKGGGRRCKAAKPAALADQLAPEKTAETGWAAAAKS
ncbi:hypothetical protein LRS73_18050 [Methylobacterium currus]|uniref:hypothetical protein n=1 Tax=Methylobacterium currus TaxID=2051553 RepID=UPI001E45B585|nr:hypothetical protein [Methylobacterium currus]UHC14451.1 hypothetical protein LRS73_18050 [Methylobacterium currus]